MDRTRLVDRLRADARVFKGLLAGVPEAQVRWKPSPGEWSLLEVACHLADEERDDFRRRLDLTLHHPGHPWPPIDPERWARERRYNDRDPGEALADFLSERERSVSWLEGLESPDWSLTYSHPTAGPISAGDLLTSWVAHDLIHIRQMTRLHRRYLVEVLADRSPDYAGSW